MNDYDYDLNRLKLLLRSLVVEAVLKSDRGEDFEKLISSARAALESIDVLAVIATIRQFESWLGRSLIGSLI